MATAVDKANQTLIKAYQDRLKRAMALAAQNKASALSSYAAQYNLGKNTLNQNLQTNLAATRQNVSDEMAQRGVGRSSIFRDTSYDKQNDVNAANQNSLGQLLAQYNSQVGTANTDYTKATNDAQNAWGTDYANLMAQIAAQNAARAATSRVRTRYVKVPPYKPPENNYVYTGVASSGGGHRALITRL